MKIFRTLPTFLFILLFSGVLFLISMSLLKTETPEEMRISQWEVFWEKEPMGLAQVMEQEDGWETIAVEQGVSNKPVSITSAWYRIAVPQLPWNQAGVLFSKVYGSDVQVFTEDHLLLFTADNMHTNYIYQILLPIQQADDNQLLYIHIKTPNDRIGMHNFITVGEFQTLVSSNAKKGLLDFVIGCALIFMAAVMMICGIFLRSVYLSSWLSLELVIVSIGVLHISYSPFTLSQFPELGEMLLIAFDVALMLVLPAMSFYFEKILGLSRTSLISRFRKLQMVYSVLVFLLLFSYLMIDADLYPIYYFFSVTFLGIMVILQLVLLLFYSVKYALRRHMEAILFTSGFIFFALLLIGELIWYFMKSAYYEMWLWKWGVLGFVLSMIIILGKTIAQNHERVLRYSKELEMYNNDLQHSEKMEMISELAATVAHEVRNPLQVTRGFLQLIGHKAGSKEKEYLDMALIELDRAASIITDFLTFAKPEKSAMEELKVAEELTHIERILLPLANLQGATIILDIPGDLSIHGNSSKFKQALINLVKNSIESLKGSGEIRIWAYDREGNVYIHIMDNGIGMSELELARLGEPYYSNKLKGTGLGLLVTFRIIEVMSGTIHFLSEKEAGTEVILTFPQLPSQL